MSLSIKLEISRVSKKHLKDMPKKFVEGLRAGFRKALYVVEADAKRRAPVKTGHLRRSIKSEVRTTGKDVYGVLSANTIYAAIQELGGTIVPKTKDFLRFQINGQWVTTNQVQIPPRPYLEPAISNNLKRIESIITREIERKLK